MTLHHSPFQITIWYIQHSLLFLFLHKRRRIIIIHTLRRCWYKYSVIDIWWNKRTFLFFFNQNLFVVLTLSLTSCRYQYLFFDSQWIFIFFNFWVGALSIFKCTKWISDRCNLDGFWIKITWKLVNTGCVVHTLFTPWLLYNWDYFCTLFVRCHLIFTVDNLLSSTIRKAHFDFFTIVIMHLNLVLIHYRYFIAKVPLIQYLELLCMIYKIVFLEFVWIS